MLCLAVVLILIAGWVITVTPETNGLVIIPGIGRKDRLKTTVGNLKLLDPYLKGSRTAKWSCIAYVYALANDTLFWGATTELELLTNYCAIVENPGKRVTENLYMAQPYFFKDKYSHVFVLLDDCKLIARDDKFDLDFIIKIMSINDLGVASPMVIGANRGGGQQFRNIMQTEPFPGSVGFISTFVELFAWVLTIDAYEYLWELLYPSVNPYGWGYDLWYFNFASSKSPNFKMGIVSVIQVKHEQNVDVAGAGRAESASVQVKWEALQKQESVYRNHFGISLRKCRLKLSNSTLYGAVSGLLYESRTSFKDQPINMFNPPIISSCSLRLPKTHRKRGDSQVNIN